MLFAKCKISWPFGKYHSQSHTTPKDKYYVIDTRMFSSLRHKGSSRCTASLPSSTYLWSQISTSSISYINTTIIGVSSSRCLTPPVDCSVLTFHTDALIPYAVIGPIEQNKKSHTYLPQNAKDNILELQHPRPKLFKPPLNYTATVKLQFSNWSLRDLGKQYPVSNSNELKEGVSCAWLCMIDTEVNFLSNNECSGHPATIWYRAICMARNELRTYFLALQWAWPN